MASVKKGSSVKKASHVKSSSNVKKHSNVTKKSTPDTRKKRPVKKPADQRRPTSGIKEERLNDSSNPKEPLTLTIDRLSDDGRGIAVHQGKNIFVSGALPNETVLATTTKQNSQYSEARVKDIILPSSERVQAPCPVYSRCGGCSMQHWAGEQQLPFKQTVVLKQLSHWSSIVPETVQPAINSTDYGYRQRVRFAVDYTKNGDLLLGFREANSQRIVDLKECAVLEPALSALFPVLRQWLLAIKPNVVSHIECVTTSASTGIVIRHTRALSVEERQQLCVAFPVSQKADSQQAIHCWFQGEKQAALENSSGVTVDPRMRYTLGDPVFDDLVLEFHPQDFIQANAMVNQAMVAQVLGLMAVKPGEHIVDLFCGVGNFSLPLARLASSVIGVEGMSVMVQRARDNALNNQIDNAQFMTQDLAEEGIDNVRRHLAQKKIAIDGLLLDPPRVGAKKVCQEIKKLAPKRIVYVSCDSATFARDAKILADNGYKLSSLGVMDMFPQTSHIETMGLFVRHNKNKSKHQKNTKNRVYAW